MNAHDINEANYALRDRSGTEQSGDPLVNVFYQLLCDELPAGKLEAIVRGALAGAPTTVYTNGWLARYAKDLVARLRAKDWDP